MAGQNAGADLQSILATLAQYTATPLVATEPNTPESRHATTSASAGSSLSQYAASADASEKPQDPRLRPQARSSSAATAATVPKPMIDPATITVWQDGLRCVTKIAAQNAQFAVTIKRMMKDQRANEIRWYTERQNLKQTQANRTASAAKAQSIIKSLNTSFYGSPPEMENPEVKQERELNDFDRKIYTAQLAMEQSMTAELKALGVPFFGTNQSLVIPDDANLSKEQIQDAASKHSPRITESQLLELQRKMVKHLEDLYRD